jgi:hypothetical protein
VSTVARQSGLTAFTRPHTPPASHLAPPGMFLFRGQYRVRRSGVLRQHVPVHCPLGHVMAEPMILAEAAGAYPCTTCEPGTRIPCGALLYVVTCRLFSQGWRIVADVNEWDMRHMEREGMEIDQVLSYLGITFPVAVGR